MPPPEHRNGPPPPQPRPAQIAATAKSQDLGKPTAPPVIPVVSGTELAPIGAAQYPRVTVHHVACGHVHVHFKFEVGATSIVRSPACARHTEYRIVIEAFVPSISSRAHRGAA